MACRPVVVHSKYSLALSHLKIPVRRAFLHCGQKGSRNDCLGHSWPQEEIPLPTSWYVLLEILAIFEQVDQKLTSQAVVPIQNVRKQCVNTVSNLYTLYWLAQSCNTQASAAKTVWAGFPWFDRITFTQRTWFFFFHLSSPRDINMMDFAQNHARVNGNVNVVPRKSHKKILVSTEPEQHQLGAHTSWSARVYASLYITFHIRPLPIKNMKWPISNIMIFFNHRSVFIRAKADFGFTLVSSVTCNGQ